MKIAVICTEREFKEFMEFLEKETNLKWKNSLNPTEENLDGLFGINNPSIAIILGENISWKNKCYLKDEEIVNYKDFISIFKMNLYIKSIIK